MVSKLCDDTFFWCGLFVIFLLQGVVTSEGTCDSEIENTLRVLLTPQRFPSIQLQSLRRQLLQKFQPEMVSNDQQENAADIRQYLRELAYQNELPEKRNLEALARAGYIKTLPDTDENNDSNYKRSIANLAKNGQLPDRHDDQKRGIESLARNGELNQRKNLEDLLQELYMKRNIGSLAREFNFPNYGKRYLDDDSSFNDKRNIASLAREGNRLVGKRNVAALLRQDTYSNAHSSNSVTDNPQSRNGKRNIGSVKAQYKKYFKRSVLNENTNQRNKREIDYFDEMDNNELSSPYYPNLEEYDDAALRDVYANNNDKRFLGSVARSGWFRPSSSNSRFVNPEKRHIGALARLGWLPTYRNIRRFNRSYRSLERPDSDAANVNNNSNCRKTSSNGKTQNNSIYQSTIPLDNKRYLLQPAVDMILLKKIFKHPHSKLLKCY